MVTRSVCRSIYHSLAVDPKASIEIHEFVAIFSCV